jgi:hypothetical protein
MLRITRGGWKKFGRSGPTALVVPAVLAAFGAEAEFNIMVQTGNGLFGVIGARMALWCFTNGRPMWQVIAWLPVALTGFYFVYDARPSLPAWELLPELMGED